MLKILKHQSEFSRNVLTLMTGTTIAQVIPIAISPILTRIYTPEDFGLSALFVAITMIFGSLATGRYELAIMLPKKNEDAINIFALGFIITIALSLLLLILVVLFNDNFVKFLNNEEIGFWLYFVPIAVFFTGLFNILYYFHNRIKNYKDIANATIIKSMIHAVSQISIGFIKSGVTGLISSQLLSSMFANIKLFKNIMQDKILISKIKKVKIIALAKRYKNFPKYNVLHSFINTFFSQLPIFILSSFFISSVVGFYSLAIRVTQIPITILSNSIGNILYEKIVNLNNSNHKYMHHIYKYLLFQLSIGIILFTSIYFLSNYIYYIFGEEWKQVGLYIKLLIPWLFMVFIIGPLAFSVNMSFSQKKGLIVEILYGSVKWSALLLGVLSQDIILTLSLFSWSSSIFIFFQGLWFLNLLKKQETRQ